MCHGVESGVGHGVESGVGHGCRASIRSCRCVLDGPMGARWTRGRGGCASVLRVKLARTVAKPEYGDSLKVVDGEIHFGGGSTSGTAHGTRTDRTGGHR